jgi:hypothetical protein
MPFFPFKSMGYAFCFSRNVSLLCFPLFMKTLLPITVMLVVAGYGCQLEEHSHPLAVGAVSPSSICAGDDYSTPISLSAKGSLAIAILPGVAPDKTHCIRNISWEIQGAPFVLLKGDLQCAYACDDTLTECEVQIALDGSTVAQVVLTVENDLHDNDFAVMSVLVTSDCTDEETTP